MHVQHGPEVPALTSSACPPTATPPQHTRACQKHLSLPVCRLLAPSLPPQLPPSPPLHPCFTLPCFPYILQQQNPHGAHPVSFHAFPLYSLTPTCLPPCPSTLLPLTSSASPAATRPRCTCPRIPRRRRSASGTAAGAGAGAGCCFLPLCLPQLHRVAWVTPLPLLLPMPLQMARVGEGHSPLALPLLSKPAGCPLLALPLPLPGEVGRPCL